MTEAKQPQQGSFVWNELTTRDTEAAKTFYQRLFGWKFQTSPTHAEYNIITVPGREQGIGGMMKMGMEYPKDAPPNWLPYIHVDNVDKTCQTAEENGGTILVPPTNIPDVGRFAMLKDPTGAAFSIITMKPGYTPGQG
jgi:predicted enzyme related to lactoylglutathione lyase